VDEIAQEAGVGKGTIYLYFESKEKIFDKLQYREAGRILDKMSEAANSASEVVARLHAIILARFRYFDDFVKYHQVDPEIMTNELRPSSTAVRKDFRKHELELLERVIREGVSMGELEVSEREVPVVCVALSASLEALDVPWVVEGRELPIERKAEVLVRIFIKGLQRT
jgi:AcrR family transcriptional regulator